MASDVSPGRPGNLTPDEEEKLRQLWRHVLKLCGTTTEGNAVEVTDAVVGGPSSDASWGKVSEKPKKKRMSLFNKKQKDKAADGDSVASPQSSSAIATRIKEADGEDKYGQTQQFLDAIANQTPETLRATIWSMVKHDHPDALLLRFLRARKWDVEKALVMMISTMNWRLTEMRVDDDIMKNGEAGAVEAEKKGEGDAKKLGADFMAQIRMGKSFLHGVDKSGRPVCVVRVRLHKQGEQCEESLERYTVYIIETARMLLSSPIDTATIIFDMTGFSMANMDYTPVKFMIKCFEANYPESLGAVLVHKAPWVFQGIWKIIRGWLDPVVASKVQFTNNMREMEQFIEPSRIITELDGPEVWKYQYVEPIDGENDKMKDTAERDRLLEARELLVSEFEEATLQWIRTDEKTDRAGIQGQRNGLARKLREDYWRLDPYVRARSLYDRTGVIQPGGKIDFYPKAPSSAPAAEGTRQVVDTSADDVD
ncbi:CRAL/TRIO domain-containing protein [Sodiomyces alkalinus F11]|uniref:CRAL/TRIO domain-containing protein n=1 Tax=Sodiomyces alkalinus (strain CBS 110278 / VKM F-3762 / F11) TaxID=1314773 RepID=A0A3N2PTU7_SODAK|nr:CRAL/TRIO domain-containing protein [Sodiomyces alkalinus F11]ROT37911.1 CRAL/TRIO domain-containing protein [Sodiomyces alkalinus F11]